EASRSRSPRAAPTRRAYESRQPSALSKTAVHPSIRINAAIAQERPVAAHFLHTPEIHLGDEQRLLVGGRLGHHDAKGIGQERMPPELDPRALSVQLLEAH